MRKFIVGAAAAAMVAGSTIAQATPLVDVRAGSTVAEAEGLAGEHGTEIMLGILAAIIVGFVIFQIQDGPDDEALPSSP